MPCVRRMVIGPPGALFNRAVCSLLPLGFDANAPTPTRLCLAMRSSHVPVARTQNGGCLDRDSCTTWSSWRVRIGEPPLCVEAWGDLAGCRKARASVGKREPQSESASLSLPPPAADASVLRRSRALEDRLHLGREPRHGFLVVRGGEPRHEVPVADLEVRGQLLGHVLGCPHRLVLPHRLPAVPL